jgi:hypothetical protein
VCENYIQLVCCFHDFEAADVLNFAAPIIEAGAMDHYDTVFFNGTINFKEKWAGPPSDARDKMWQSMIYGMSNNVDHP